MFKKFLPVLLVGSFLVFGCESDEEVNKEITSEEALEALGENMMVTGLFKDASNVSDESVIEAEASLQSQFKNATQGTAVTIDPMDDTWPKTITVDFGTEGVTGLDGVIRKGVLVINSSAPYYDDNSVHVTTFDNFYQNGYKIEGTHTVTNMGLVQDVLKFHVEIEDGKVTTPDGDVILYTQDSYRSWIAGADTPLNIWDDEHLVEGVQGGVSSKDIEYTMTTSEPLHFVVYPRQIAGGVLEVFIEGFPDIVIDFDASTITFLGTSYPLPDGQGY